MLAGLINPHQYSLPGSYRLNAPITLAYLARRLADHDIECDAIDLGGLQQDENFILEGLEDYDAVGITAMSIQAEGARRLLKLIRYHRPDLYVACGGVDVSLFPQQYLDWGASAAVVGQADGNIHQVFQDQPQGLVAGQPGPIDGRPLWERHRPYPWQYPGHPHPLAWPEAISMFSRGCPHRCTFCGNVLHNRQRTRRRAVEDVVDELRWLQGHGVKAVFEYSDEIVDSPNLTYLLDILSSVQDLLFRAQGRCNITRDQAPMLEHLAASGLRRVMWGVESFSDPVLEAMDKDLAVDSVMTTLELAHAAGLENFIFLMTGMPEETSERASQTAVMLERVLSEGLVQKVQVTPCTPMPGTALYQQAQTGGWLHQGDPFQYQVTGGTPWMSQGEIAAHTQKLRQLAGRYHAL